MWLDIYSSRVSNQFIDLAPIILVVSEYWTEIVICGFNRDDLFNENPDTVIKAALRELVASLTRAVDGFRKHLQDCRTLKDALRFLFVFFHLGVIIFAKDNENWRILTRR